MDNEMILGEDDGMFVYMRGETEGHGHYEEKEKDKGEVDTKVWDELRDGRDGS